jgi:CubicO group peptidase (beta-lactamase class C family)
MKSPAARAGALLLSVMAAACTPLPPRSAPALDPQVVPQIDNAINAVIAARQMPGAVFYLERDGDSVDRAYGRVSYEEGAASVSTDTVYDIASLSKVVATAPSVLLLAEQGKIDLDAPLVRYFPECANGRITIRHLLTHSSGLPSGIPALPAWQGDEAAHALACAATVTHPPGTFFRYSDVNYVLLGQLVQRLSGQSLAVFAGAHLFAPLKMKDTGYLPLARMDAARIAPTHKGQATIDAKGAHGDVDSGALLQGVVHDPTVRRIGGVAGSAGLFSTTHDLARYARMLLNGGELDGVRVLSADSVRLLTTTQSPPGIAQRAMGMDIDSPYARPRGSLFPVGSYGHTGFTGCILWIDPGSRTFYVFLSNRVYPDDKANILPLYGELGTLSARAAGLR